MPRALRRPRRLHPERRARSGRDAAGGRARSRRAWSSASRSTTSTRCRSRAGTWSARIAASGPASAGRRARSAAATRCSRAAAAPSSAPTARTASSPAIARGRSRTSSTRWSGSAIRCRARTSSSAIRSSPSSATASSSCATRSESRGLNLTFEAETRLDRLDVDLLDTLYAAGFRAMSFGVESLDPATLKKSGRRPIPQTHQREIIDALPQAGHRDGGVLRARLPAGRLELDRGDDRLRDRPRIDLRAVQDADAVSRARRCSSRSSRC